MCSLLETVIPMSLHVPVQFSILPFLIKRSISALFLMNAWASQLLSPLQLHPLPSTDSSPSSTACKS